MKNIDAELSRCYRCQNRPCMSGCPLGNNVKEIITLMNEKKYEEAFSVLSETSVIPAICSRVCPHLKQCQSKCTAGFKSTAIDIGLIESFLGDIAIENDWDFSMISNELKDKQIAIIGSGPAGLNAAAYLVRNGAKVTIFEKREKLGGLLTYGIPAFRLDKDIVKKTIDKILQLGVKEKCNCEIGKDITLEKLEAEYDAIMLAFGANVGKKLGVTGESLEGVYSGNELLEYANHPSYQGKKVFVFGGGNVAIDSARTAKRLGAKEVTVVYRRTENEMPAEIIEVEEAKKDGVTFLFHTNMFEISGMEKVSKIKLIKTEYREEKLQNVTGSEYEIDADIVITAIGSAPNDSVTKLLNVELNEKGYIKVNNMYQTSDKKVFATGDLIGEKATVAWASRSGRNAAEGIKKYLENK